MRESKNYFLQSALSYGGTNLRKTQRLLSIALRLLGANVPHSYTILLQSAIPATFRDPTKRVSISNSIFLATKEMSINIFDASGWYQLSSGLFSMGYFRAAWIARENSLDLSISESLASDASATAFQRGIEAHLERRNFTHAETLISRCATIISADRTSEFHEYLSMMQGFSESTSMTSVTLNLDAERAFDALIGDKNVVVVGPSSPSGEYGDEIDSADTVVRLKFVGTEYLPEKKYYGSRCDISQYNQSNPLTTISSLQQRWKFLGSLKLIITLDHSPSKIADVPVLYLHSAGPLYRTTETSGIRLLRAVIKGRPSRLKVFGMDFYSRREQYNSQTLQFYSNSAWILGSGGFYKAPVNGIHKSEIAWSFSGHDVMSNFCFAQNLHKAGLFEIEPYGKSILELTPYQYVERLEEMLGDW